MARIRKDSLLAAISGHIGKEIVIKDYGDKMVVSKYPDMSKVKASKAQKKQRKVITEANNFASSVLRDPKLKKKFEKKLKPGESVYHKAKKTYFDNLKKGKGKYRI